MDYVTRQFINLTKKFRRELPKLVNLLHHAIQKHTEAIHSAKKSTEQKWDVQPRWLDPVLSKYQETVEEKKASDERHYAVQNSIRWATWSAVIAAIIYGTIAGFQWRDANRNFAIDERAWVGMTGQTIVAMNNEVVDARIVFTNTGKTPAHRIQKSMSVKIAPPPLIDKPSDSDISALTFIGSSVLSPQSSMTLSSLSSPEQMLVMKKTMANYLPLIEAGTEILYFFGEIKYDDSSAHSRLTKYCVFAYKTEKGWGLAECNGFNEMD